MDTNLLSTPYEVKDVLLVYFITAKMALALNCCEPLLFGTMGVVESHLATLSPTENKEKPSSKLDKKLLFDPAALKAKYAGEREKRIRANPDGVEQYRAVEGSLSHYLKDPWVGQDAYREPIKIYCEVLIIGGGYGGQLMAKELLDIGIQDFRIVEKGADFGGAW